MTTRPIDPPTRRRTTYSFTLIVDATSAVEADAIVNNILGGRTFGHEVNGVAFRRNGHDGILWNVGPVLNGDVQ